MGNETHVVLAGLHALSETDLRKRLREKRVLLGAPKILDSESVQKIVAAIKEALEDRGYMDGAIDVQRNEELNSMTFVINEGPRFPIADIRFEGNKIFSGPELVARTNKCLQRYEQSRQGYDVDVFDYCLRTTLNSLRGSGYLQARLGDPQRQFDGQGLILTVPVEEGALYRLGEIRIEGSDHFSPGQIRGMLPLRRGDIADSEAIGKWLFEDLKQAYGEAGYIQFTAEPEPEFKRTVNPENDRVVDLRVTIEEGNQFTLRSIKFLGADMLEPELQEFFVIREGNVYNQKLFEQSVARLNATGLFETIDKDKDCDFRTNEEEAWLEIVIKVRRAANP